MSRFRRLPGGGRVAGRRQGRGPGDAARQARRMGGDGCAHGGPHVPAVERVRRRTYGRPVATMRASLEAMQQAPYGAPEPSEKPLTILAALGPRRLALSAMHADGAHPYNVPPEHTAEARSM